MQRFGDIIAGYNSEYKPFELPSTKNAVESACEMIAFPRKSKSVNNKKSSTNEGVDEMKNIYQRADGRFEYSKLQNGERIYFISKYKSKVIEKVRAYRASTKNIMNSRNFKNIVNEWYNNFKVNSLSTKAKLVYQNTLNNYILPKFEKFNIGKITYKDLQIFVNGINKLRVREMVCQHLKAIFSYAYSNRYILINPTTALKLPKKTTKTLIKPLTLEEQKELLKTIQGNRFEKFLIFSLVLGTRRNESLAFKLEDINLEKGTIHINGTKTENAERDIKISQAMIEFLMKNAPKGKYFDFSSETATKQTSKILQSIGINKTLHALRHTCATNLFYLGWKDKARQQYLGHANIITTNNVYTYLENDVTKKDIKELYNDLYFEFDDNFDDKK